MARKAVIIFKAGVLCGAMHQVPQTSLQVAEGQRSSAWKLEHFAFETNQTCGEFDQTENDWHAGLRQICYPFMGERLNGRHLGGKFRRRLDCRSFHLCFLLHSGAQKHCLHDKDASFPVKHHRAYQKAETIPSIHRTVACSRDIDCMSKNSQLGFPANWWQGMRRRVEAVSLSSRSMHSRLLLCHN